MGFILSQTQKWDFLQTALLSANNLASLNKLLSGTLGNL
jgi:hypothetical protein